MKRFCQTYWLIWLAGALLTTATQIIWLKEHRWDGVVERLVLGPLAGAIIVGLLAFVLAFLIKGLFKKDLTIGLKNLSSWFAGILGDITGLNRSKGRICWLMAIILLLLGTGVFAIFDRVYPMVGQGKVRSYFIEHAAKQGQGLQTFYFNSLDNAKSPKALGTTTNFSFKTAKDFPGNKTKGFEIRWLGMLEIDKKGVYGFGGTVDDGLLILLNGKPVVDEWKISAPHKVWGEKDLEPGVYALEIRYFQSLGDGTLKLFWQKPGEKPNSLESAPMVPLKPETPLLPLTRLELRYHLVPNDLLIYPPFGEGRHWRLLW